MAERNPSIIRLILIPSIITLAITVLRLVGELQGWPVRFFNPAPGGYLSIVGIVWLVPIFGIYFAIKLAAAGKRPESSGRAIGMALLGFVMLAAGFWLFNFILAQRVRFLVFMWGLAIAGAALQFIAWPALFKVLLAYGYAARIPVAIIMCIATQNVWESHYSALVLPEYVMSTTRQYVLFGFFPQLVWWVSFTVIIGSLFGCVAAAIAPRTMRATAAASK